MAVRYCSQCGTPQPPEARFCGTCGTPIGVGVVATGGISDTSDAQELGYAVRWVGTIVSSIPLFLGYFWMIWDGRKQTWHDKFAGSVVVKVRRRGEL